MRAGILATIALLPLTGTLTEVWAADSKTQIEITTFATHVRSDGSGASTRGLPTVTTTDGQECKVFFGNGYADGRVDVTAIRMEFTPTILSDGRVQLRFVSLGTELGEKISPDTLTTQAKPAADAKINFHSALPSDGLFSVAGQNGSHSWLRIGQKVDGWTLTSYDSGSKSLSLLRGTQSLRLSLVKASTSNPNANGAPRVETITMLPGEQSEIIGKDGHRLIVKVRLYDSPPPAR
jgi:hypothetical protein